MSHHSHPNHDPGQHRASAKRGLHTDWRMWVAVALMLGAMLIYVLTLDEADVPPAVSGDGQPVPVAPAQP